MERAAGVSPLRVEIVEGTSAAAWEQEKTRRRAREERAGAVLRERRATADIEAIWDAMYQDLAGAFGDARSRRHPLTRAEGIRTALKLIAETEARARALDPDAEAFHERQLNRIIDRAAVYAEVPPALFALEYLRARLGGS